MTADPTYDSNSKSAKSIVVSFQPRRIQVKRGLPPEGVNFIKGTRECVRMSPHAWLALRVAHLA